MKSNRIIMPAAFWLLIFTFFTIRVTMAQNSSSDSGTGTGEEVLYWWPLDHGTEDFTPDIAQQKEDSLYGNFEFVPGIHGNALKLDGFRTYIRRNPEKSGISSTAFTTTNKMLSIKL